MNNIDFELHRFIHILFVLVLLNMSTSRTGHSVSDMRITMVEKCSIKTTSSEKQDKNFI